MAGDWIKMRKSLLTDPKVVRIASALDADRLRTIGGLFSAWCLFDEHTQDGQLCGYTPEVFDEVVGIPGISRAMEAVGWVEITDDAMIATSFAEHNGQTAKRRAKEAVRKTSARDADKMRTREEKRREEKREPPKSPKGDIAFDNFWSRVHLKTGKDAARRAFQKAVDRLSKERGCDKAEAAGEITEAMAAFARSPAASPTDHTPIHPATWLNSGRYQDDRSTWGGTHRHEIKFLPRQA